LGADNPGVACFWFQDLGRADDWPFVFVRVDGVALVVKTARARAERIAGKNCIGRAWSKGFTTRVERR